MENAWLISGHDTLERERKTSDRTVGIGQLNARRMRMGQTKLTTEFRTAPPGRGPYVFQGGRWCEL